MVAKCGCKASRGNCIWRSGRACKKHCRHRAFSCLNSSRPRAKGWWARRVNTLDQLEVISATRGLTAEETVIKERILKEITEAAQKPSSLAINAAPYTAPVVPAAPMTSAEYQLSMAQALTLHAANERKLMGAATPPLKILSKTGKSMPGPPPGSPPPFKSPSIPPFTPGPPPLSPSIINPKLPKGGPPSPTLAPMAFHSPPSTPHVGVVKRITNTNFGPASNDPAEVKLDPITNRRNLATLLLQRYGARKPDEYEKDTWHDALMWFDDLVQEYTAPAGKKANFPKYILDVIDRASPKCDIFVAYLTPVIDGTLTDFFLNKHTTDGSLPKIAESSASGGFYYHPNYRAV